MPWTGTTLPHKTNPNYVVQVIAPTGHGDCRAFSGALLQGRTSMYATICYGMQFSVLPRRAVNGGFCPGIFRRLRRCSAVSTAGRDCGLLALVSESPVVASRLLEGWATR